MLLPDEDLVDRVLMSLPSSWTFMRQLINARENPITYSGLEDLLLQEDAMETRINAQEEIEEAMAISQSFRIGHGKGRGDREHGRGARETPTSTAAKSATGGSRSGPAGRNLWTGGGGSTAGSTIVDGGPAAVGGGSAAVGGGSTAVGRNSTTARGTATSRHYTGTPARNSNSNLNSYSRTGMCHECGSPDHWADKCEIRHLKNKIRDLELNQGL